MSSKFRLGGGRLPPGPAPGPAPPPERPMRPQSPPRGSSEGPREERPSLRDESRSAHRSLAGGPPPRSRSVNTPPLKMSKEEPIVEPPLFWLNKQRYQISCNVFTHHSHSCFFSTLYFQFNIISKLVQMQYSQIQKNSHKLPTVAN